MIKSQGFTLLEILVTLIVLSLLALYGVSGQSQLLINNEKQTLIDEIKTAVHYAKLQSMLLGKPLYLLPLDSKANWSKGMILTETTNRKPICQWQWQHPQWQVTWTGFYAMNKIQFSNNPANAISNGRFKIVNLHNQEQSSLVLNKLGRLRILEAS